MVGGAPRGTVACGGYGGELCLRDPRSKMRAEVNLSSPAHSAGVQSIVRYFYFYLPIVFRTCTGNVTDVIGFVYHRLSAPITTCW